jgi:hypothetical protein
MFVPRRPRVGFDRSLRLVSILASLAVLEACGSSSPASTSDGSSTDANVDSTTGTPVADSTGNGTSAAPQPGGSSSSTGSSGGDAASSSETMAPPIFDHGIFPDLPPDNSCKAVDFLFVIDNSGSMFEHQQNLVANFPTFINGIQGTLQDVDSYQVGVVTTDAFAGNPPQCMKLGALVTSTTNAGPDSSNAICGPYSDGHNYMTEEDDLEASFNCAARVGTQGNGFERPMDAVVGVVGKDIGEYGIDDDPGNCNEGFLRDDALLVIVVITDEYDGMGDPEGQFGGGEPASSSGTPETWYDAVVAAKNGIPQNAVALAITNYANGPCIPTDVSFDGVNIVAWTQLFEDNGFVGGICEQDYTPFFTAAIDVIQNACENFVPT